MACHLRELVDGANQRGVLLNWTSKLCKKKGVQILVLLGTIKSKAKLD